MNKHLVVASLLIASAVGCGGDSSALEGAAPTGSPASLLVQNQSGVTIYYLYVSPCSSSSWGPDQLGSNVIPSRGSHTVHSIPGGCYDLKAEGSGHSTLGVRRGVSLPADTTTTWFFTA